MSGTTSTQPQEEWWHANHVRGMITIVMPVFVIICPPICRTPLALVHCVHASLSIIGLVPALRLLLSSDTGAGCRRLAWVFTGVNGLLFTSGTLSLLGML